jgi:hypothetical protein
LFIASSPAATAAQIVAEFIATEILEGPRLVDVATPSPYVGEGLLFDFRREQHSNGSECVGRVLEGI